MIVSIWKSLQHLSAGKKSTSSFMFSLRYCKDIVNWLFFGTLGLSGYLHPKWYYHLVEYFCVYLQAKTQFHLPSFYGDIAKIWKLILGTLGMHGYTHPKWQYHLAEDFDVYLHAKNKLHNSLLSYNITFQRILQFDWPAAFWSITWDPKLCQICWWICWQH